MRRRVSLLEFDAAPDGFVPIKDFIRANFRDSSRKSLTEIRVRKAKQKLEKDGRPTPAYLRMAQGLSQLQLAEAIGTSQPAIARMESGQEKPSFDKLVKLREVLMVTGDELMQAITNASFAR